MLSLFLILVSLVSNHASERAQQYPDVSESHFKKREIRAVLLTMIAFHFIQFLHLQIHPYAFNIIPIVDCVEQEDCVLRRKNISVIDFSGEGSVYELQTVA